MPGARETEQDKSLSDRASSSSPAGGSRAASETQGYSSGSTGYGDSGRSGSSASTGSGGGRGSGGDRSASTGGTNTSTSSGSSGENAGRSSGTGSSTSGSSADRDSAHSRERERDTSLSGSSRSSGTGGSGSGSSLDTGRFGGGTTNSTSTFGSTRTATGSSVSEALADKGLMSAAAKSTPSARQAETTSMSALDTLRSGPMTGPTVSARQAETSSTESYKALLEAGQRALLDTIASTESPGYNVRYGGATFDSYADHPRVGERITSGPNKGDISTAAGRYQFLEETWDEYAAKLGLTDFSPASQDKAALALAADKYKAATGKSIDLTLVSDDDKRIAEMGRSLSKTWTSLPGGIEATTTASKFTETFKDALAGRPTTPDKAPVPDERPVTTPDRAPVPERRSFEEKYLSARGDPRSEAGAEKGLMRAAAGAPQPRSPAPPPAASPGAVSGASRSTAGKVGTDAAPQMRSPRSMEGPGGLSLDFVPPEMVPSPTPLPATERGTAGAPTKEIAPVPGPTQAPPERQLAGAPGVAPEKDEKKRGLMPGLAAAGIDLFLGGVPGVGLVNTGLGIAKMLGIGPGSVGEQVVDDFLSGDSQSISDDAPFKSGDSPDPERTFESKYLRPTAEPAASPAPAPATPAAAPSAMPQSSSYRPYLPTPAEKWGRSGVSNY